MEQEKTQHLQSGQSETALRKCPQCDTIFSAIAYCPNDGQKLENHFSDAIHHTLFAEKYEILDEIGKGGMGTVYRVKQIMLDKIFALKVIPSHYLTEQLTVRFQREARTMASLDHPNLGRIFDFGIWLNQPFMVMEYIDGSPLSKIISERVLPASQAVEIFSQVLDGLAHAHERGVLHRDIKPSNIMVRRGDSEIRAVLLDFGIAKRIDTDDGAARTQALTRTGEMIGSPLYMSPEQARGDKLTERSDLYSVGCALFESLTGTPPFVGKTAVETFFLHLEQIAPTLKEASLGRDFTPAMEAIIRKLLAKNPDDRYASAEELKHALCLGLKSELPSAEINLAAIKKRTVPALPIIAMCLLSIAFLTGMEFFLAQGEKTAKEQEKKVSYTDSSSLLLLRKTEPNELINAESRITHYSDTDRGAKITKRKDGSMIFYKRIIKPEMADEIAADPTIKKLAINQSSFDKEILGRLPKNLQYLELNGAGLVKEDYEAIAKNKNLVCLSLRLNIIRPDYLQPLTMLEKLTTLDLSGTHSNKEAIARLKPLKNLKVLGLSDNNQIDDSAVDALLALPQLESLDISNTRLSDKGLRKLSQLPQLRILGLKCMAIADSSMPVLNNFKHLKSLWLAGNPITDEGFQLLKPTDTMREFDLSDCALTDGVATHLLRFKNLDLLHISRNQITWRGFAKLAKLPLRAIWCKRSNLSEENAYDFLDQCPTCKTVYYTHNDYDAFTRSDYLQRKAQHKGSNRM